MDFINQQKKNCLWLSIEVHLVHLVLFASDDGSKQVDMITFAFFSQVSVVDCKFNRLKTIISKNGSR